MQFIQGNNRHQTFFAMHNDKVAPGNAARLIFAWLTRCQQMYLFFVEYNVKTRN